MPQVHGAADNRLSMSTAAGMEAADFFDLLESNNPTVVDDIKTLIQENIYSCKDKDPWLISGLFDYYVGSGSERCMEVLIGISREPHDKFLIDKITEGVRVQSSRKASLTFLGHLVHKQPSWLYKIAVQNLFREVLRVLKIETDIIILMSGLLIITSLLPIIPTYIPQHLMEIFEIFGRLTTWAHTSRVSDEDHLLHLQVGLYSMFHRLYAMYPCNFLSYLRHTFSLSDRRGVFAQTIKPMLETVKLHPMLVTATKEYELTQTRWKNKEYHDIIAECSQVSLDVLESGLAEEVNPTPLRPRIPTTVGMDVPTNPNTSGSYCPPSTTYVQTSPTQLLQHPVSTLIHKSISFEITDLSSLATMIEDTSAPPTPLSTITTPSVATSTATSFLAPKPKSAPEAAMEATPENTPMPTPIKDRNTTHFKLPTPGSPAVMHLAFGKPMSLTAGNTPHTPPANTPANSVPSSPAPHKGGDGGGGEGHTGGGLHRRDSIFDSGTTAIRKDSAIYQRLQKIMVEQQQGTEVGKKPNPGEAGGMSTLDAIVGSVGNEGSLLSGGGGPLTPMLGGVIPAELNLESLDDEESDELKSDPVPLADKRSMIAFAQRVKRLRYYSQCGEQNSSGPSPGTSPSTSFITSVRQLKRSKSCPDIFKKYVAKEEPTDSTDGVSSSSHQLDSSDDHASTPKAVPVQPYEHLFETVLPQFLQHPGENHSEVQSPHHLLDICVSKAAAFHGMARGDELNLLRGHVELLHTQLLFERHRREAHALRNRSLAKRCRTLQQQEDKTYALKSQIHCMEKELAILLKEVSLQRNQSLAKEKELQQDIAGIEKQVLGLKQELISVREQKEVSDTKFSKMREDFHALQKETGQLKSEIFQLENEILHCKKYVDINAELKMAYETAQKEILMLGELYRRQEEVLLSYEPNRYLAEEMEDFRLTFEDEIKNLKNILESKSSQTEAALGFINNLETQLAKKDVVINEQKKLVQDTSYEYDAQLRALEDKYESLKAINHRLELEILNLQHQVTVKTYAPVRGSIRRTSPSNGDSLHNSNNSDVDSAASAGGLNITPGERNVFIFGSPQFGPTPLSMNDLQRVIEAGTNDDGGAEHRRVTRTRDEPGGSRARSSRSFDSPPGQF